MFGSGSGIGWGAIERVVRLILEAPTRELFVLNGEVGGDTMLIAFGYLVGVISIRCILEMTWVFVYVDPLRLDPEFDQLEISAIPVDKVGHGEVIDMGKWIRIPTVRSNSHNAKVKSKGEKTRRVTHLLSWRTEVWRII